MNERQIQHIKQNKEICNLFENTSFLGYQPNIQVFQHLYLKAKTNNKRQNELIPYNDCLYRNMYRYEYIALLDIDEVNETFNLPYLFK